MHAITVGDNDNTTTEQRQAELQDQIEKETKIKIGSENLLEVLQWAAWIAFGVCVLGFVIAGGAMAVGSQRGDGHQHGSRLAWIMAGCIVIASASGLVGALA